MSSAFKHLDCNQIMTSRQDEDGPQHVTFDQKQSAFWAEKDSQGSEAQQNTTNMSLGDSTTFRQKYLQALGTNAALTRVDLRKYQEETLSMEELDDQEGHISSLGDQLQNNLAWPKTSSSIQEDSGLSSIGEVCDEFDKSASNNRKQDQALS